MLRLRFWKCCLLEDPHVVTSVNNPYNKIYRLGLYPGLILAAIHWKVMGHKKYLMVSR